jgi:hypothetical protein
MPDLVLREQDLNAMDVDDAPDESDANLSGSTIFDEPPEVRFRPTRTRKRLTREEKLRNSVCDVLHYMQNTKKLDMGDFLHLLFYGDSDLRTNASARQARKELFLSAHFESFLLNLAQPPRTSAKGERPKHSPKVFLKVAQQVLTSKISNELDDLAQFVHMDKANSHEFCLEDETETIFEDIEREAPTRAPILTHLLTNASAPDPRHPKLDCKVSYGSRDSNSRQVLSRLL